MQVQVVVVATSQRSLEVERDGKKETIKVVDLDLSNGIVMFHANAYDKMAQRIIDNPFSPGSFITANLDFSVRVVKTENAEILRYDIKLVEYDVLYDAG